MKRAIYFPLRDQPTYKLTAKIVVCPRWGGGGGGWCIFCGNWKMPYYELSSTTITAVSIRKA